MNGWVLGFCRPHPQRDRRRLAPSSASSHWCLVTCRSGKSHVRHVYWPLMDVQLETWSRRPPEGVLGSIPRHPALGCRTSLEEWDSERLVCSNLYLWPCVHGSTAREEEGGGRVLTTKGQLRCGCYVGSGGTHLLWAMLYLRVPWDSDSRSYVGGSCLCLHPGVTWLGVWEFLLSVQNFAPGTRPVSAK